jgi:predicted ferric reductase
MRNLGPMRFLWDSQRASKRLQEANVTRKAAIWIAIYLLAVMAPLAVLLAGPMPPSKGFWWDFSMALGFAGMAMMAIQFALTSRFKATTRPFGIDIVYLFHRYLAIIALAVVFAHFAILWLFHQDALGALDPRTARIELTLGRVALLLFALAVATSEFRKFLRLEYGLWRYTHVAFAMLGFAAAIGHIVGVGYYIEAPSKRVLWLSVTLVWALAVIWVRILKPWSQLRHPYRVSEVRRERGNTWTLALEPKGHEGLSSFMPGQFAWLTFRCSPFLLREHPFSIVSPPEHLPRIEFGIKELGDFTATIGGVKPGETVYLDGPYGVFSIDRNRDAWGFVGIVGGIGITPLLSMLRSMAERNDPRPVWLFYGSTSWDSVIYREEIEALKTRLDLTVIYILDKAPDGWDGETGYLDAQMLERHLPKRGRDRLHCFLCGPVPMTAAAEKGLHALGVPASRIQTEIFELV